MERLRRLETNQLIDLAAQIATRAAGRDRNGHNQAERKRAQGTGGGFHARSGSQPVVDKDERAPSERGRRMAFAIQDLAPLNLLLLARDDLIDDFLGNTESADHVGLENDQPSAGNRAHGQFFLAGNAEFAHHKDVQRQVELGSHLEGYGNAAARQAQDKGIFYSALAAQFVAQDLRQYAARLPAILKDNDHAPPFRG